MLSGFTSQLGSLGSMISKKATTATTTGESAPSDQQPLQEAVETPPATTNVDLSKDLAQEQSVAGPEGSTTYSANILNSVRNHVPTLPSWLGGGAKKVDDEANATGSGSGSPTAVATPAKEKVKEDEGFTAMGVAESDQPLSEEELAAAGAAGTSGVDKVKNLGNYLFSSIKGAGQKIRETSILGEFQREHDSFLKSKSGKGDGALAPWVGHVKEDALKEEILSLSNDRRNFVRSPPQGVNFDWDWNDYAPIAKAILKDDPNLENMRYTLVPKVITEENFWRNYFYRVQLLKESMDDTKPKKRRGSSSEEDGDGEDADLEKELNEELKSFEVVGGGSKHDEKEIDSLLDLK